MGRNAIKFMTKNEDEAKPKQMNYEALKAQEKAGNLQVACLVMGCVIFVLIVMLLKGE